MKIKILFLTVLVFFSASATAQDSVGASLSYTMCTGPDDSSTCSVAFQKMRQLKNPITGKIFFDNDVHYMSNGQLFMYPSFAVAQADLDGDGFKEIITVPKESYQEQGLFCQKSEFCPHYILQDRNPPNQKPTLKNIRAIGPIYTYGIGLSTDEIIGGHRSLRAYTNKEITEFDVYQYDRKTDDYYNISEN